MSATWKWLHGFQAPVLLKHEFGPSNYTIWLTDLQNIWVERLDRKSLLRRALSKDISIDPSEDASQMQKFLSHIKDALNLAPQTNLRISSDDDGSVLKLNLRVTLPQSLPDLEWTCELTKCASDTLTQALVLPLLASHGIARLQQDFLLTRIREKDTVISKLIAQMQADGSDFSKTFPGSAALKVHGKADARQLLGRAIKGMAQFDDKGWQDHVGQDVKHPTSMQSLVQLTDPVLLEDVNILPNAQPDGIWWKDASQVLPFRDHDRMNIKEGDPVKSSVEASFEASTDADFQRQSTPPKAKHSQSPNKSSGSMRIEPDGDDSTTDDSQDESEIRAPQGIRHNDSTDHPQSNDVVTPAVSPNERLRSSGAQRPTESSPTDAAPNPQGPRQADGAVSKPKAKLGRIGGKRALDDGGHANKQSAVGHHSAVEQAAPVSTGNTNERGRQETKAEEASSPRETSIERANRNRERLKHELDSKTQAGKKKKRKF